MALVAALTLAGCGRKGPLELPPNATGTPKTPIASDASVEQTQPAIADPGLIQPPNKTYQTPAAQKLATQASKPSKPINGPQAAPSKPFILDPLL